MSDLKPGRELDALVAEKVMGWSLDGYFWYCGDKPTRYKSGLFEDEFSPSTDIAAAWEVVEKLNLISWNRVLAKTSDGRWCTAVFSEMDQDHCCEYDTIAESAPHAICLAALKAVGG